MSDLRDSLFPFQIAVTTTTHARACSPDDGTDTTLEPEMIDDPSGAEHPWALHDAPGYPLH